MMIELPPVEADLLCLVDRTDEQANPDRQELDFRKRYLDISRDDEPLIQDAIEHVDQPSGSSVSLSQWRRHRFVILRTFSSTRYFTAGRFADLRGTGLSQQWRCH